ncbi:DUF4190 domain-containing protein [Herbiconiux sp. KACC 21604]|uniref:DUF4190 domain-containing protein n=1 Tax=unclassified Herbiconiux TaxID=2618217 RepID=UPI0014913AFC|nr:DUF4190 domain-containing protein [Herbiconiux sp. SALV-R1]QJU55349.1 DUF4190 domain-containing protein [Herbiconiux sp. SALV-R1]WPO86519.1 DUF4190 domain-containing protein [Herbiconiux sp. KACC 21604]
MTNQTETLDPTTHPTDDTRPADTAATDTAATAATTPVTGGTTPGATGGAYAGGPVPPMPTGPAAPQYYAPAPAKTNTLGIITLVLGVLGFGLVPVITGHIALNQIKRTHEDGRGITLAGLILGYVTLAGWLAVALFWIAAAGIAIFGAAVSSY